MKKNQLRTELAECFSITKIDPGIIKTLSRSTSGRGKIPLPIISAPPEDISVMFGIPVGVLNNWRWMGVGPKYYKRKRRITYFLTDVISFLKECPHITSESLPDKKEVTYE